MRIVDPQRPARVGTTEGLSYALWLPDERPRGTVVVLHGADSTKERHFGFARACHANGFAAIAFDARGHGESTGALGGGALDDIAAIAAVAREATGPDVGVCLRGSSMGGFLAICAATHVRADAVIAICPAPGSLLLRGLESGRFDFRADQASLEALLLAYDLRAAAAALPIPLLLMHATGDASVAVEHSRDLAEAAPDVKYVEVRGGHHGSIQHDAELTGVSLRWLGERLGA